MKFLFNLLVSSIVISSFCHLLHLVFSFLLLLFPLLIYSTSCPLNCCFLSSSCFVFFPLVLTPHLFLFLSSCISYSPLYHFLSSQFLLSSPLYLCMLATFSITLDLITRLKCDIVGRTATYFPKKIYRPSACDAPRFHFGFVCVLSEAAVFCWCRFGEGDGFLWRSQPPPHTHAHTDTHRGLFVHYR